MSEAPAQVWLIPSEASYYDYHIGPPDQPDAVRYVRADIYEAVVERLRISQHQAPVGTDYPR